MSALEWPGGKKSGPLRWNANPEAPKTATDSSFPKETPETPRDTQAPKRPTNTVEDIAVKALSTSEAAKDKVRDVLSSSIEEMEALKRKLEG